MFKKIFQSSAAFALVLVIASSCNTESKKSNEASSETSAKTVAVKTENVYYSGDGVTMKGFVAFDSSNTNLKPVVLIVPEWWGISDYTRGRAKQLAALGYLAFAVDFYGEGKTVQAQP